MLTGCRSQGWKGDRTPLTQTVGLHQIQVLGCIWAISGLLHFRCQSMSGIQGIHTTVLGFHLFKYTSCIIKWTKGKIFFVKQLGRLLLLHGQHKKKISMPVCDSGTDVCLAEMHSCFSEIVKASSSHKN